ncbi:MAG: hypothetical protein HY423_13480 [Candidatus Lambdaproteobacteria bacterium]|nr:hypothetical protein [Candidatus Lambdaproteobacteria bacterium]
MNARARPSNVPPQGALRAARLAARRAPRPWWPGRLRAAGAMIALAAALALAGCGYEQNRPRLPGKAERLTIGLVQNRTYTGELDVRLREEIRKRLLLNDAVVLTSPEQSELTLELDLNRLDITRTRDLSNTNVSGLTFALTGRMVVVATRDRTRRYMNEPIAVTTSLSFDRPVIETPSVRDEGISDLLRAFAREVELRLLW